MISITRREDQHNTIGIEWAMHTCDHELYDNNEVLVIHLELEASKLDASLSIYSQCEHRHRHLPNVSFAA